MLFRSYIESCRKIKYMFPKAHAVAYLMSAIRLMWYKIYKPQAFYAVYFTVRGDDIDYEAAISGAAVARAHMEAVKRRLKEEKNAKDEDVLVSLQLVNEMLSRGYEFLPIELGKSRGSKYVVEDDKVRLPFSALKGLGGAAAEALERVTIHGEEYISRWKSCSRPPAWAAAFWIVCVRWAHWATCPRAVR